jgi:hypothetical protein
MESDYQRITGRYMKLFGDLNKELSTRIHQIDQPAFLFKELAEDLRTGSEATGAVSMVMVFNSENTDVQVKLGCALAKKQADSAMRKIKGFLVQQKTADAAIRHCMQMESEARDLFIPACIAETITSPNIKDKSTYLPTALTDSQRKAIVQQSSDTTIAWAPISEQQNRQLRFYFNKELNYQLPATGEQNERVRKMIQQLARIEDIQTTS